MHFCTAYVALSEDTNQSVFRGEFNPISWPEVQIIQSLHGEGSVDQIKPFVDVPSTAKEERDRLAGIYGGDVVEKCWPGRNPNMTLTAPKATLKAGVQWRNPISREIEETSGKKADKVEETPEEISEEPAPVDDEDAANPGIFDDDFGGGSEVAEKAKRGRK